jgi:Carboxypeptidase regulatory-like domain
MFHRIPISKVALFFALVPSLLLSSERGEVLKAYVFDLPDSPAVLEHKGRRYDPHVLGIRAGQPLLILNNDPTHNNTHPTPRNNPEWNQTQPPGAPPVERVFLRPETFIPFKSNHHPWQKAYVGVFSHPFFATSDALGQYKIEGLPPGQYTVVAWHERFGEKTVEISVAQGEAKNISFTFEANDSLLPKSN